jgi:hypothetical protein
MKHRDYSEILNSNFQVLQHPSQIFDLGKAENQKQCIEMKHLAV